MHEDDNRDIIDEIDALTDDAANWSADGGHSQAEWATPAPGAMTAIELSMEGAGPVDISEADPGRDIARLVGDPGVDRLRHLRRVQFWVGDNSVDTSPVNIGATRFLHRLLAAVRDGHYIASDAARDHARALLDNPDDLPVIHGPSILTGVGDDGGAAPLDENFQDWFGELIDRIAQLHPLAALAEQIGIPLEQISHISVLIID